MFTTWYCFRPSYSQRDVQRIISQYILIDCSHIVCEYLSPRLEDIVNYYLQQIPSHANPKLQKLRHEERQILATFPRLEFYSENGIFAESVCILHRVEIDSLLREMYFDIRQMCLKWPMLRNQVLS